MENPYREGKIERAVQDCQQFARNKNVFVGTMIATTRVSHDVFLYQLADKSGSNYTFTYNMTTMSVIGMEKKPLNAKIPCQFCGQESQSHVAHQKKPICSRCMSNLTFVKPVADKYLREIAALEEKIEDLEDKVKRLSA